MIVGRRRRARFLDAQDGEVVVGVGADRRRIELLPRLGRRDDPRGAGDDVVVGQDDPLGSMITPEPSDLAGPRGPDRRRRSRRTCERRRTVCSAAMLTTAGETFSTTSTMSLRRLGRGAAEHRDAAEERRSGTRGPDGSPSCLFHRQLQTRTPAGAFLSKEKAPRSGACRAVGLMERAAGRNLRRGSRTSIVLFSFDPSSCRPLPASRVA